MEASRVLAEAAIKGGGKTDEERIRFIFRRLTAREPEARELELLKELLRDQAERFQQEPERANSLVSVGERKRDGALNAAELAATTAVAQTVMNLDATVWKR